MDDGGRIEFSLAANTTGIGSREAHGDRAYWNHRRTPGTEAHSTPVTGPSVLARMGGRRRQVLSAMCTVLSLSPRLSEEAGRTAVVAESESRGSGSLSTSPA